MGFYPVSTLVHDARAHGVEVRPVNLAHSAWDCTLEGEAGAPAVRLGLRLVRGLGARGGERAMAAGVVIVRQRPGTAKGFVFVGLEDETGRLDVIVPPALYARERETINGSGILAVRGRLGVEDGVTNLRAERFWPLRLDGAAALVPSHDYH